MKRVLGEHPGPEGESPLQVQTCSVVMGPPTGKPQRGEPEGRPRSLNSAFDASGDSGYAASVVVGVSQMSWDCPVKRKRDGARKAEQAKPNDEMALEPVKGADEVSTVRGGGRGGGCSRGEEAEAECCG